MCDLIRTGFRVAEIVFPSVVDIQVPERARALHFSVMRDASRGAAVTTFDAWLEWRIAGLNPGSQFTGSTGDVSFLIADDVSCSSWNTSSAVLGAGVPLPPQDAPGDLRFRLRPSATSWVSYFFDVLPPPGCGGR